MKGFKFMQGKLRNWGNTLLLVVMVLAIAALLMAGIYLQNRIHLQTSAIAAQRLDYTILGQLIINAGTHQVPAGFRSDPTEWVLTDAGLEHLRQIPGVAQVLGYENRYETLVLDKSGTRLKTRIMVVPKNFFIDSGIADQNAERALEQGDVVIPQAMATQFHIQSGAEAMFELMAVDASHAVPDGKGFTKVGKRLQTVATKLTVIPVRIPEGMSGFEKTIFIGMNHALRRDQSNTLPMPNLWIRLSDSADTKNTTLTVRHYLKNEAPRVFDNATIEVQNLGEVMAGAMTIDVLKAMQFKLFIGGLLGLLSLVGAMIFLRWGTLLRELALRQALGQTQLRAVMKCSRPVLYRTSLALVLALVIALGCAYVIWMPPMMLMLTQITWVLVLSLCTLSVLPLCAWLASFRAPIRSLNVGGV